MRTMFAICAALVVAACDGGEPKGQIKGVERASAGQELPEVELRDGAQKIATLAALKGKPVLVNLWATWCVPCVKELPTLEALSQRPDAPRVIAVSQDMTPRATVNDFLSNKGIDGLEVWHDPEMALSGSLSVQVLPTTILYGADGKERWRYTGDLDWTGSEAAQLLQELR